MNSITEKNTIAAALPTFAFFKNVNREEVTKQVKLTAPPADGK